MPRRKRQNPEPMNQAAAAEKAPPRHNARRFICTGNKMTQKLYPQGKIVDTFDVIRNGHHPVILLARKVIAPYKGETVNV